MPYEDPIEAALRALTDVEWTKRKHGFETRVNHTHMEGIQQELEQYNILVTAEVSAARSGRYIVVVKTEDTAKVLKAVGASGKQPKPNRRKSHT